MFLGCSWVVASVQYTTNQPKFIENLQRMKNSETEGQTQHLSLQTTKAVRKEWKEVTLRTITGKILKQIIKQSIFKRP